MTPENKIPSFNFVDSKQLEAGTAGADRNRLGKKRLEDVLYIRPKAPKLSSVAKGRLYEDRVRRLLEKKNFKLLKKNFRTPYAEVDLIFRSPERKVFMIEVKKASRVGVHLSHRQAQRLERARQYLSTRYGHEVRCHLAIADAQHGITFIKDILAQQLEACL